MSITLIIIGIVVVIVLATSFFFWGMWIGFEYAISDNEDLPDVYCFQCEIEMPAKEKNGSLYCSNCGLRHQIENHSIYKECPHNIKEIRVIESICGCEVTTLFCPKCKKQLEEPKTEC